MLGPTRRARHRSRYCCVVLAAAFALAMTAAAAPREVSKNISRGCLNLAAVNLSESLKDRTAPALIELSLVVNPDNDEALFLLSCIEDGEPVARPNGKAVDAVAFSLFLASEAARLEKSKRAKERTLALLLYSAVKMINPTHRPTRIALQKAKRAGVKVGFNDLLAAYSTGGNLVRTRPIVVPKQPPKRKRDQAQSENDVRPKKKPAKPIQIGARDLYVQFKNNPRGSADKYIGKDILTTGTLTQIVKVMQGKVELKLVDRKVVLMIDEAQFSKRDWNTIRDRLRNKTPDVIEYRDGRGRTRYRKNRDGDSYVVDIEAVGTCKANKGRYILVTPCSRVSYSVRLVTNRR